MTMLSCGWADAKALQAAADALSAKLIRTRLDYWTLIVGPKFSKKDRWLSISAATTHCNKSSIAAI